MRTNGANDGAAMLTPAEVAELVGLSAAGVRRGPLRRKLPWVQFSPRCLRVPRSAVERLVERGEL